MCPVLSPQDAESFVQKGYLHLHRCFSREFAEFLVTYNWLRSGLDPRAPKSWPHERVGFTARHTADLGAVAPKLWKAICELLGGEDRLQPGALFTDGFVVNYRIGSDGPWQPPDQGVAGWHVDGDDFVHFLDSPEQPLLIIMLFSDVGPRGGGTYLALDSVARMARYLVEHPEGVRPEAMPYATLISECSEFLELNGETGDAFLIHPLMLHCVSANQSERARFITVPRVRLREPQCFSDPATASLLERTTLQHLGVPRLDFAPTGPREAVTGGKREQRLSHFGRFLRMEAAYERLKAPDVSPSLDDLVVPGAMMDYPAYERLKK